MMEYLNDFQGVADAGSIVLNATERKRLPDIPCRMAYLVRWNASNDGDFSLLTAGADQLQNSNIECYFGFNGKLVDQLFTGTRSPMLYVKNLNQITVANPKAGDSVTIYYVYFR